MPLTELAKTSGGDVARPQPTATGYMATSSGVLSTGAETLDYDNDDGNDKDNNNDDDNDDVCIYMMQLLKMCLIASKNC